jgi:hypothetical protein
MRWLIILILLSAAVAQLGPIQPQPDAGPWSSQKAPPDAVLPAGCVASNLAGCLPGYNGEEPFQADFVLPYNFNQAVDCGMPGHAYDYFGGTQDPQHVWCPTTMQDLINLLGARPPYDTNKWSQGDIVALQPQLADGSGAYIMASATGFPAGQCGINAATQWLNGRVLSACDLALPASINPKHKTSFLITQNYQQLPPPGNRVGDIDKPNEAALIFSNPGNNIVCGPYCNNWRLVGLEITSASTGGATNWWSRGITSQLLTMESWNSESGKRDLWAANGGNDPKTCPPPNTTTPVPAYCEYLGAPVEVGMAGEGGILTVVPRNLPVGQSTTVTITTQDSHMCDNAGVSCSSVNSVRPTYVAFGFGVVVNSIVIANVACPAGVTGTCQTLTANVTVYDNAVSEQRYYSSPISNPTANMPVRGPYIVTERSNLGYHDEFMFRPGAIYIADPKTMTVTSVLNTTHNNESIIVQTSGTSTTSNPQTLRVLTSGTTMTSAGISIADIVFSVNGSKIQQIGSSATGNLNGKITATRVINDTEVDVDIVTYDSFATGGGKMNTLVRQGAPSTTGTPIAVDPAAGGNLLLIPDTNPNSWIQSFDCYGSPWGSQPILPGETYTCQAVGTHTQWDAQTKFYLQSQIMPNGNPDIQTTTVVQDATHATVTLVVDQSASQGSDHVMIDRCDLHGVRVEMEKQQLTGTPSWFWEVKDKGSPYVQNVRAIVMMSGKYQGARDSRIHDAENCAGVDPCFVTEAQPVGDVYGPGPKWIYNTELVNGSELLFNGGTGSDSSATSNLMNGDMVYIRNYAHDNNNNLPAAMNQVLQNSRTHHYTDLNINLNAQGSIDSANPVSGFQPSGWKHCPSMTLSGGDGIGAGLSCSVVAGKLAFQVVQPGIGYTVAPDLNLTRSQVMVFKNIFESKNVDRWLVYGNVNTDIPPNSFQLQFGMNILVSPLSASPVGPVQGFIRNVLVRDNWMDMSWQSLVFTQINNCGTFPHIASTASIAGCMPAFDPYGIYPTPPTSGFGTHPTGQSPGSTGSNYHVVNNLVTGRDVIDDRRMIPDPNIWQEASPSQTIQIGVFSDLLMNHNTFDKRPGYLQSYANGIQVGSPLGGCDVWNGVGSSTCPVTPSGTYHSSILYNAYIYSNVLQCLFMGSGQYPDVRWVQRSIACPTKNAGGDWCAATQTGGGDTWQRHLLGNIIFDANPALGGSRFCSQTTSPATPGYDWTLGGATSNMAAPTDTTAQPSQYVNTSLYIRSKRPGDWTLAGPTTVTGVCPLCPSDVTSIRGVDGQLAGINNTELMSAIGQDSVQAIPRAVTGQWTRSLYNIIGQVIGAGGAYTQLQISPGGTTIDADSNGNFAFLNLTSGTYDITGVPDATSTQGCTYSTLTVTITGADQINQNVVATCSNPQFFVLGNILRPFPAAGAPVTVTLSGGAINRTAYSQSNGEFAFPAIPNGTYTMTPALFGFTFTPASATVSVNNGSLSGFNFSAVTTPGTYSITGSIQKQTGAITAEGRYVNMVLTGSETASGAPVNVSQKSNLSSGYSFSNLQPGTYTITPSKVGYTYTPAQLNVTITTANITGQNFKFTPVDPYSISGVISGAAMAGTTVNLTGAVTASTVSSSTGFYYFSRLAVGAYTVTPQSTIVSFSPASRNINVSNANMGNNNFSSISGGPIYTISGTVTGVVTAGVAVNLTGPIPGDTVTDTSGNYSFTNRSNGTYTVTPALAGNVFTPSSASPVVNNNHVTGVNFTSAAGATGTQTISGTVTGTVSSGVDIVLTGANTSSAKTDASGNYSFANLGNGAYTITPSYSGATFTPAVGNITLSGTNQIQNFTSAIVTYTVTTQVTGAIFAGVLMTATNQSTNVASTCTTNATPTYGGCNFQLPNGTYVLVPSLSGFSFSPTQTTVTVNGANPPWQIFTAAVAAPTYNLGGIVRGAVAANVTMTLSGDQTSSTTTDATGVYSFQVPNGNYTVTPSQTGYTFRPTAVNATVADADYQVQDFISAPLGAPAELVAKHMGGPVAGAVRKVPKPAGVPKKKKAPPRTAVP